MECEMSTRTQLDWQRALKFKVEPDHSLSQTLYWGNRSVVMMMLLRAK
jgi:hypothetical protein